MIRQHTPTVATLAHSESDITLRVGTPGDADRCGVICYEAFRAIAMQHAFPPDFPDLPTAVGWMSQLLARHDVHAVVAEAAGLVIGSNFLWEGDAIAGIGPITVDPAGQNVATGRRLMEDVLRRAQGRRFAGVRLVQAAYHNRSLSLYTKLGFEAREPLSTLQGLPIGLELRGRAVRPARDTDLDGCNRLCSRVLVQPMTLMSIGLYNEPQGAFLASVVY